MHICLRRNQCRKYNAYTDSLKCDLILLATYQEKFAERHIKNWSPFFDLGSNILLRIPLLKFRILNFHEYFNQTDYFWWQNHKKKTAFVRQKIHEILDLHFWNWLLDLMGKIKVLKLQKLRTLNKCWCGWSWPPILPQNWTGRYPIHGIPIPHSSLVDYLAQVI